MNPLVSIIIPTYNRAEDLKRAISSVLAQSYDKWEAVIIDNHSDDDTNNVIRSFNDARIKTYKINNAGVIASSRNLGISNANGKYVAFLDSDDWWNSDKLQVSVNSLESGYDFVYHPMFVVKKNNFNLFLKKTKVRDLDSKIFNDLIIGGNCINTSSVVLRKSIIDQVGGMSEDKGLIGIEDFDTWLRVAKVTQKFQCIHKALGFYWVGISGGYWNNLKPDEVSQNFHNFKSKYSDDFDALYKGKGFWVDWIIAVAYLRSKNYTVSKKYFLQISKFNLPLLTIVKVKLIIIFINIASIKIRMFDNL